jgi:hypothetical protein
MHSRLAFILETCRDYEMRAAKLLEHKELISMARKRAIAQYQDAHADSSTDAQQRQHSTSHTVKADRDTMSKRTNNSTHTAGADAADADVDDDDMDDDGDDWRSKGVR